jgi:hypothetical protein
MRFAADNKGEVSAALTHVNGKNRDGAYSIFFSPWHYNP